jgi:hypothetical protein
MNLYNFDAQQNNIRYSYLSNHCIIRRAFQQ